MNEKILAGDAIGNLMPTIFSTVAIISCLIIIVTVIYSYKKTKKGEKSKKNNDES